MLTAVKIAVLANRKARITVISLSPLAVIPNDSKITSDSKFCAALCHRATAQLTVRRIHLYALFDCWRGRAVLLS